MRIYGRRLAAIRNYRRMTQKELAAALKLTTSTIHSYESDRVRPSVKRVNELARALHCTVTDLTADLHAPLPLAHFRGCASAAPLHKHHQPED